MCFVKQKTAYEMRISDWSSDVCSSDLVFVGATTENPSFELNSALLSRCRVHVLDPLSADDIVLALERALHDDDRGLGQLGVAIAPELLRQIAIAADGDVRRGLDRKSTRLNSSH